MRLNNEKLANMVTGLAHSLAETEKELCVVYRALEMSVASSSLMDDLSPEDWIAKAREDAKTDE